MGNCSIMTPLYKCILLACFACLCLTAFCELIFSVCKRAGKRLAKDDKLKQCCTLYSVTIPQKKTPILFCMQDGNVEIYGKPWAKCRR